jgi:hypothetical protein
LPPIPDALRGTTLDIEYVSAMALAQRAAATAAMEQFAKAAGSLAGIYPEAKLALKAGEWMEEYADLLNVPAKVVASQDEIAAGMQQLAQQQAEAQAAQTGMAAVQGAQTLSQTDVGGGANALQMLLGQSPSAGGGGPPPTAGQQ